MPPKLKPIAKGNGKFGTQKSPHHQDCTSCCSSGSYPFDKLEHCRYLSTALLRKIFMFKCRLPLLRLVPALHLLSLPAILSVLEAYHQRMPPSSDVSSPTISAVALASFPPLWFFGFLYYTDVPGIAFVLSSFVAQSNGSNWLACLVSVQSCSFLILTCRIYIAWVVESLFQTNQYYLDTVYLRIF
jgi:alpha-1,2-glucosyltransferase